MTFTLSVHKHSQPQMHSKPNLCYETIHLTEGQMWLFLLKRHWTSARKLIKLIRMWSRYWAHISACAMNTCSYKTPYKPTPLRRVQTSAGASWAWIKEEIFSCLQFSQIPDLTLKTPRSLRKRSKHGLNVFPLTAWCVKDDLFFILKMGHKLYFWLVFYKSKHV